MRDIGTPWAISRLVTFTDRIAPVELDTRVTLGVEGEQTARIRRMQGRCRSVCPYCRAASAALTSMEESTLEVPVLDAHRPAVPDPPAVVIKPSRG